MNSRFIFLFVQYSHLLITGTAIVMFPSCSSSEFRLLSWDSVSKSFQLIRQGRLPNVDPALIFPLILVSSTVAGDICVASSQAVLCMSSQFYDSSDLRYARVYKISGVTSIAALSNEPVVLITCTTGVLAIRWPSVSSSSPERIVF